MSMEVVWGACFEVVGSTAEGTPGLQALFLADFGKCMRAGRGIRQWLSWADDCVSMVQLLAIFPAVTYQDDIVNRRFLSRGSPKSTHSIIFHLTLCPMEVNLWTIVVK